MIDLEIINKDDNYKDILMRLCQANHIELPDYQITSHEQGVFTISVVVDSIVCGIGKARNKKMAEQTAAKMAIKELDHYKLNA